MDSLTQIVLGAGVAEVVLGRKAGNRAPLWGAIAGTIPDLDVIPAQGMDTVSALAFHRGISHSLLFSVALAPLLGWLVSRLYHQQRGNFREWALLFFLALFTHALLDCFTTWGVQLFWPLPQRIAWKSIFVIDPLYTLPFLVCLIWLMFKPRKSAIRKKIALAGLLISSAYLGLTLLNKWRANRVFEQGFYNEQINVIRYESRPTPLQNVLWTANAETEEAFYIGFYSFRDEDREIDFQRYPKNQTLPPAVANDPKVQQLISLTKDWYNLERLGENRWLLNDFRFGQIGGYQGEQADFVFSYEITATVDGEINIREWETTSTGAGREMLRRLWQRIWGG